MRVLPFITSAVITTALVVALNKKWGAIPPLGNFLSPQHGFWQNAEASDASFNEDLKLQGIKGKVNVYFDEKLVPHVFADNNEDLYFVQGYLHAKFRLWQMEFQTFAAAGRVSEFLGNDPRFIAYDREMRRSGMVYAAENSLKAMEADPVSKASCDAYTAGVNAYIQQLPASKLPIEYKLLDYKPELWSNFKTALFLKQMSRTLSSNVDDLEMTNEQAVIPFEDLKILYPQVPDSLEPMIPKGTAFAPPGITPVKPSTADSLYFKHGADTTSTEIAKENPNNGSNNWVVSGSKTKSGAPILCNDPHLELSFPSIWYEMQLNSPDVNVYGATFPGSPSVIIGFNDSVAWGVTNSQRDVKDFYELKFKDDSKKEYWFNGAWKPVDSLRREEIKVKGSTTIYDTVAYTVFGPVMFDKSFTNDKTNGKYIACKWSAHEGTNEGITFYKLNRTKNYDDYLNAIKTFSCPGQNFVFASKSGDIALWQQGKFPARWYGQGLMVMPGQDSSYMWQGYIPQQENPHAVNPAQGFLESANQRPVDSTYPYFIPGGYITARGISITRQLQQMQQITPQDMMKLQNNYFNVSAEDALPKLNHYLNTTALNTNAQKYLGIINKWNFMADAASTGQTIYAAWWLEFYKQVYFDELDKVKPQPVYPNNQTLLEALIRDSAYKFADNINTTAKETWTDDITAALNKAADSLAKDEAAGKLEWTKNKSPRIFHLLKTILPFSQSIPVGGNGDIINATTISHGPSWRMIVHLTNTIEAYGVYPGGQSGNPGSRFYNTFVDKWVNGEYNQLWFMKRRETGDARIKWSMTFTKA